MHVRLACEDAHGGHVGLLPRHLLCGQGGWIGVEALRIVPGVFGDATRVQCEKVTDRLARNLDAHRVDQNQARDQAGRIAHRHLGSDPTTERGADHQHVAQLKVVQGTEVHLSKVTDPGQFTWPLGAVPPWVRRGQRPRGGREMCSNGSDGHGTSAAVQDQDGSAMTGVGDGKGNIGRRGEVRGGCICHWSSPSQESGCRCGARHDRQSKQFCASSGRFRPGFSCRSF